MIKVPVLPRKNACIEIHKITINVLYFSVPQIAPWMSNLCFKGDGRFGCASACVRDGCARRMIRIQAFEWDTFDFVQSIPNFMININKISITSFSSIMYCFIMGAVVQHQKLSSTLFWNSIYSGSRDQNVSAIIHISNCCK